MLAASLDRLKLRVEALEKVPRVAVAVKSCLWGVSGISCAVGGWTNQAIANVKRSPKRTANWALAMDHSRGGMIH